MAKASASPNASTDPNAIPILHLGKSVTFADPQSVGDQGATVAEKQTWKLTAVKYITYAEATAGGTDGDVAAQLGADALQPGYRYLVLGLTVTDGGPSGVGGSGGVQFTLTNADYAWSESSGKTGTTTEGCVSSEPLPGQSTVTQPYVSSLCSTQNLEPGQSASGYVFFAVPDTSAIVALAETSPEKVLSVIDPDNLAPESECDPKSGC
jgi:hypothetical protein